jgi:hypothetical protein
VRIALHHSRLDLGGSESSGSVTFPVARRRSADDGRARRVYEAVPLLVRGLPRLYPPSLPAQEGIGTDARVRGAGRMP